MHHHASEKECTMRRRIREVWSLIKTIIQSKDYTPRESVLAIVVIFLLGIFFGILISPKKEVMVGSNNGSNNVGFGGGAPCEGEKEEEASQSSK